MAKTGPNDASDVVWALVSVFLFFIVLLDTNKSFIQYIGPTIEICDREGRDNDNGSKRRKVRRLDPR